MATHSSTLAWEIPWTKEPGRLQSMGSQRVRHTERLHFNFSLSCTGEGNGNPLQCSCLENPRDRGAWWAAGYGVTHMSTELDMTEATQQQQQQLHNLSLLTREKAGLKLNIQKTKIKASSPIISWQIDGEKMETVTDFIFLGSKITTDGDFSHEIKRRLLLRRKAVTEERLLSLIRKKNIAY